MPSKHFISVLTDQIFHRVLVDTASSERTRVFWELRPDFADPLPYTFTVEYNPDYNNEQSWQHFAGPVVNQVAVDGPPIRLTGKTLRYGLRVLLTTPVGSYASHVVDNRGNMTERQWLHYRAAVRRLSLIPANVNALQGVLLKRKWFGPYCECVDQETNEITDTSCRTCYGTGIVGGYWKAGELRLSDISVTVEMPRRDPGQARPPTDPQMVTAMLVGIPPVQPDDVWVRLDSNRRYYVRAVRHRSEVGGIPLNSHLEMGLADYGDVIYSFPID